MITASALLALCGGAALVWENGLPLMLGLMMVGTMLGLPMIYLAIIGERQS
jgi:hypothetical protein